MNNFESSYIDCLRDMVNDSASEVEILDKVETILKVLYSNCDSYTQLSLLKSRIKRLLKKEKNGVLPAEEFDRNMNKILSSANDIIKGIKVKDIAIEFDYNIYEGFVYLIRSNYDKRILFEYTGSIKKNKPHGNGKAKYPDNSFYEGEFKDGNRDGYGILYNKNKEIIKKGRWLNNKFYEKDGIKYFHDIKVAANSIQFNDNISESDYEIFKVPGIRGEGLISFPVEGNSMEPNYSEGDLIICKEIKNIDEIVNQAVYVIFHDERLVLKRIKSVKGLDSGNKFRLISDNYINHPPYLIVPDHRTKFFKLILHMIIY